MKLLPLALASLACLLVVSGAKSLKSVSSIEAKAGSPEAQRKRDAGYSYLRPRERIHARIVAKIPSAEASRPFVRYGPPRQESGGFKQASVRPQQNLHIFIEDAPSGRTSLRNAQQRAPSAWRAHEFVEASPIAAQNDLPFDSKSANYLPPSNQKLPGRTSSPYSFANDHQPSNLQNHQALHQQRQISDAAAFLAENSRAISQLYETPATDIDYQPSDQQNDENTKNSDANFHPIDNLPSYASGFVDQDTLRNIKSLEKDRLIKQLRHELVDVRGKNLPGFESRYPQNSNNNNLDDRRNLPQQNGRPDPQPDPSFHQASSSAATSGYTYHPPSTPATLPSPTVASTLVTTPANQAPQASASHPTSLTGSGLQQPATSLQFPQFAAGFVPSLVPNYLTSYPISPIGSLLTSGTTHLNNAPTHFGIPIPTFPTTLQKPTPTIPQNPQTPVHPAPGQSFTPITTNPIQPFPLVPAVPIHQTLNPHPTNLIGHPTYGVQSNDHVKPIKAVYPVYYYQNVYQLQKPGLATLPWHYAPSYPQHQANIRPEQAWK